MGELRERIRKRTGFLATVQEKDLAGVEERKVAPPSADAGFGEATTAWT